MSRMWPEPPPRPKGHGRIETITEKLPTNGRLFIRNRTGNITVEGWDREEVQLTSEILDSSRRSVEFRVHRKESDLMIEAFYHQSSWRFFFGASPTPVCEMSLRVPRKILAFFATRNGSIFVKNLEGFARCDAANGDVVLRDLAGEAWAETSYGHIQVRHLNGRIKGSTTSGNIQVEDVAGGVTLRTLNGSIKASGLDGWGEGIVLTTASGSVDVELGKATGELVAEGGPGLVDVKVGGNVAQETEPGRVRVKIPGRNQKIQIESKGGKIRVR